MAESTSSPLPNESSRNHVNKYRARFKNSYGQWSPWVNLGGGLMTTTVEVELIPLELEEAETLRYTTDDSELEDLAHAANQEVLSFGVSLDPFLRLAKAIRAMCTASQAQPADALDAARFRWLVEDHEKLMARIARNALCERLAVMSYSAACADIDAAMAAAQEGGNAAKGA